jgi:hypothetical protein
MTDPLDLNQLYFVDALVYAITFDAMAQAATITIEAEATFHQSVSKLLPESIENMLVDVVLSGAQSLRVERVQQRNGSWAADEKPHDWEVAEWHVRTLRFRSRRYLLNVRCQLGQEIRVAFEAVTVRASNRRMGIVHDYGRR